MASDDPADRERDLTQRLYDKDLDREVKRRLDAAEAASAWSPPDDASASLADLIACPPPGEQYRIAGLLGLRHNLIFAGERKIGKTSLLLDASRASVDGGPFLGAAVTTLATVGYWNFELDPGDFARYATPIGIHNTAYLHVANLRGRAVPFLHSAPARAWTIAWLKEREVRVWITDTWRVVCAQNRVRPNLDEDVAPLLDAIDEIKAEAGVEVFACSVHVPHQSGEPGQERFKGAGALGDWADAIWTMVRGRQREDYHKRFMKAEGRGIDMPESEVVRDPLSLRWAYAGGTREDVRKAAIRSAILGQVAAAAGKGGIGRELVIAAVGGKAPDVRAEIGYLVAIGQVTETRRGNAKILTPGQVP